jgi:hypothetical protein
MEVLHRKGGTIKFVSTRDSKPYYAIIVPQLPDIHSQSFRYGFFLS